MKRFYFPAIVASLSLMCSSCMTPVQNTPAEPQTTIPGGAAGEGAINDLLGGIMGAVGEQSGGLGGVLGNILSSVTGSATTTQANLVGTWTYTEPAVQFESENLLTQAGGGAAATSVEEKLVGVYKRVGITPGKMVFSFTSDYKMSCTLGSRVIEGTYTFDAKNKMVSLITASGLTLTAYITISGQNMCLCFDNSKLLNFISAMGGTQGLLGNIGTVAQSFSGMKTGFKFKK